MPDLGFHDHKSDSIQDPRDNSPDSVTDFNFSLLSSASASGDRCSFASDTRDVDSVVLDISQHLAGLDILEHSGSDRDQKKILTRKIEKENEDIKIETEDEHHQLDSARGSFSMAFKECQARKSRNNTLADKRDLRKPASLDLNTPLCSSPRLGTMKKNVASSHRSGTGTFPRPNTPNYSHGRVEMQKAWSSERVPSHPHTIRRQMSSTVHFPFYNGRTSSKWKDAERWIINPLSGDGGHLINAMSHTQRRVRSKSGPLEEPEFAYSLYSPVKAMHRGNGANFVASSPFSSGAIAVDGKSVPFGVRHEGPSAHMEPCIVRSTSVPGDNLDNLKPLTANISHSVPRRDMATQMSPESDSVHTSPQKRLSVSLSTPSVFPINENIQYCTMEVRDVQVSERITMSRWSKKNKGQIPGKNFSFANVFKRKASKSQSLAWNCSQTANRITRVKCQEAKIIAWESLQKVKAEEAIRKLEVKLEKKRSISMDKIMSKLRSSQKRSLEMKNSIFLKHPHQVITTSDTTSSFHRPINALTGCFTCDAL